MQVVNRAPGKHLAVPLKDKDGRDRLVAIVKYTYRVDRDGRVERDEDGREPLAVDEPNGEDVAKSSIKRPSDLFDEKPGTDVVLVGSAMPRGGASSVDVSLQMGGVSKIVRAHGLRAWQKGLLGGLKPGPALPIKAPVALMYELAWGGLDASDPEKPVGEPRNYVGRGVARDTSSLVDKPAAQLEMPGQTAGERGCVPASFGPIHRHWQPRARWAGTYDKAWEETRMPLLPRDFDARFNIAVPLDQHVDAPMFPDEPIAVLGATELGTWKFRLPGDAPRFSSLSGGKRHDHATHLDTVVIDAHEMKVELTWRACVPYVGKLESIDEVRIVNGARS
jgi:hypothetical protein